MKPKVILIDVDGVLLDWKSAFLRYMENQGFKPIDGEKITQYNLGAYYGLSDDEIMERIEMFNGGHWEFGTLPENEGAIDGVSALVADGYRFIAITSCSTYSQTVALRRANLYNVFGDIFDAVHCVSLGESKTTHLAEHDPKVWIEDKPEACEDGLEYGHNCVLLNQDWNVNAEIDKRVTRCNNWSEIVNHIIGE